MHQGKKYITSAKKTDSSKSYPLKEAVALVKDMAYAKFDETVELSLNLGVDPKQSDQNLRGTILLPHGSGKKVRVLVFAKGEKESEATAAGADFVGADDLIKKVSEGWTDFDVAIATPDIMAQVGKLGKILGVRGLMPNPKTGTVTFDVAKAVRELKAGKVEFRVDKGGNVHCAIGKASFDAEKLEENARALLSEIVRAKPSGAKGQYMRTVAFSTTMGPGLRLDPLVASGAAK